MIENPTKNIRETIKSIFDLYETMSDFIFTTYDFDPAFFEEHVISYLMGNDKSISTYGELNAADTWIQRNNLSVYYDLNALKVSDRLHVTLPTYPKQVENYVFHPKVIVLFGELKKQNGQRKAKKAVHIIVSSCNLTVSGYGRNLESFSYIKVETRRVANSLLHFIEWLRGEDKERHQSVCYFLKNSSFTNSDAVDFFWNSGNGGMNLVEKLSMLPKGNLRIISPYFDEKGPNRLLKLIDGKEKITIMPALDGDHCNILLSDYKELVKQGVNFSIIRYSGDENRFAHAKLLFKGDSLIIGSYNFTSAALEGHNAEAALIYNGTDRLSIKDQPVVDSYFMIDPKDINNKDERAQTGINVFVSIIVDWKSNELSITARLPQEQTGADYIVKLDGVSEDEHQGWKISGELTVNLDDKTIKALLKHKVFAVYHNGIVCLKGIVTEKDWEGIRPELVCVSLDETILEWYEDNHNRVHMKDHNYDLRPITEESNVIDNYDSYSSGDAFDNYYLVSYSMGRLCGEIEDNAKVIKQKRRDENVIKEIREAEKKLYGILVSKPGSMCNILSFIESDETENKERDVVFYWLVVKYLKRALELLPLKFRQSDINENYEKQKIQFENKLNTVERKIKKKIKVKKRYLEWIENELFNSGK